MTRPYKPETLRALADEAEQLENSHNHNGERRTADLLYRVKKALRYAAQAIEARRAETGTRADDDPIGWLHIPRPTPAVPDEGLVERLREGVKEIGLHEDNNTELFDIDGANEVMWEAANALATLSRPTPGDQ